MIKYYLLGRNSKLLVREWNSCWENFNLRPENWDLSCRHSELSIWTTELNPGRNHHLPAGGLNKTYPGEILNIRSENAILCWKVSRSGWKINFGMDSQHLVGECCARLTVATSGWKIEISLAEARKCLDGGLSSTLLETIIFRPEDSILPGWVKFSTSGRRTQFLFRKFQLFGWRSEIYLPEHGSYLLERVSATLVEINIFRQEDSMLPAWGKFSTSGRRMQFLLRKIQLSGRRIEIYIADSGSFLLEWSSSILVEAIISQPEDYNPIRLGEILIFRLQNDGMFWEKFSTSDWRIHRLPTSGRRL